MGTTQGPCLSLKRRKREGDCGEETEKLAVLTDWLCLELSGCTDLAQPLAVEGRQSYCVPCLRLQAHDGDNAFHVGCGENMGQIKREGLCTGKTVWWKIGWWVST